MLLVLGVVFLGMMWFLANNLVLVRMYFWGTRSFDSATWKLQHAPGERFDYDHRGEMMFSLLLREGLLGKTRAEVEALLGTPDWHAYAEGYNLGNHSGLRIDPDVLHVEYDREGRVSDFRVVQY